MLPLSKMCIGPSFCRFPSIVFDNTRHLGSKGERRRLPTNRNRWVSVDAVIPWERLISLVEPHYKKPGRGRRPMDLETMLRTYFLQHWSDRTRRQRTRFTRARRCLSRGEAALGLQQGALPGLKKNTARAYAAFALANLYGGIVKCCGLG
jgi:hypothetical protein